MLFAALPFLELLGAHLGMGSSDHKKNLEHVLIKSYANTFQNIMQEKILPFFLVRLQGLQALHCHFNFFAIKRRPFYYSFAGLSHTKLLMR